MSRKFVTVEQGMSALPDGNTVHTFRNSGAMLVGADCDRDDIKARMEKAEHIELAGDSAKGMGHGIAIIPENAKYLSDVIFVETEAERLEALEAIVP